jgi:hypothetical protein
MSLFASDNPGFVYAVRLIVLCAVSEAMGLADLLRRSINAGAPVLRFESSQALFKVSFTASRN